MKKYKYVFVVLVYKNIEVLKDFFYSLHLSDHKVVVVNSYYDDESLKECQETALANNADFIPVENKGFGYGNNVGTEFALEHYNFDFLVLSNSDIHIHEFCYLDELKDFTGVIAPKIQVISGKMQNPNIPWKIRIIYPILHYAYNHNKKWLEIVSHIITRVSRELFLIYSKVRKKNLYKIFCCHGSFIIFSCDTARKLYPFFDERMFLYNEESYLAFRCEAKDVGVYYCPRIKIEHLEGASSNQASQILFENNRKSYNVLYEHIRNGFK